MSENDNVVPGDVTEVKTEKKKRKLRLPKVDKNRVRNGLLIAAAGAGSVLLYQSKTKKTVTFDVSTADVTEDTPSDD